MIRNRLIKKLFQNTSQIFSAVILNRLIKCMKKNYLTSIPDEIISISQNPKYYPLNTLQNVFNTIIIYIILNVQIPLRFPYGK